MLCSGLTCVGLRGSLALQATFMGSPHPTNTHLFTPKMRGSQFSIALPCSIIPFRAFSPGLVQVTVHKHSL